MKHITDYIEEELFANPMNTTGMGNIGIDSGDVPCCAFKRRRKKKNKKVNKKEN